MSSVAATSSTQGVWNSYIKPAAKATAIGVTMVAVMALGTGFLMHRLGYSAIPSAIGGLAGGVAGVSFVAGSVLGMKSAEKKQSEPAEAQRSDDDWGISEEEFAKCPQLELPTGGFVFKNNDTLYERAVQHRG